MPGTNGKTKNGDLYWSINTQLVNSRIFVSIIQPHKNKSMNLFQISKMIFPKCMILKLTLLLVVSLTGVSCADNSDIQHYPLATDSLNQNDSNSLRFFVLSDWGYSGSTDQRSVAAQMSQISKLVGIQFILTCGDNFQVAGVESVNDAL